MTQLLDRIAADLLTVEQDLRIALRRISRGEQPAGRRACGSWVELTRAEVRTLLRGAMPAPIATSKLRRHHGRLVAALSILSGHLLALNDPMRRPDAALGAACSVVDELRAWIEAVRWQAAARRAGVKWPAPQPVTAVMRLPGGPEREHLPNAAAGQLHHPAAAIRLVRQLRTEQLDLDLTPASSAEVIDLRQLRLAIDATPPVRRAAHAHATA